ncbi:type I-F CRISPR-associated endoribonuclease Cas6/Csy4 [Ideonella sp. TBM-1]|uniref:Type I-F CRISPR-associated endoribonuclease Cas6/Csy4 n=1 Tax=Ideonella livida TaxID=2707176 RepID=A0A7C9PJ83_9BURK|nr:type I-F CRISPR-associated endoribonuclease Cas6/Csy4 [Ideonella livida]
MAPTSHYLELTLHQDPDFTEAQLMSALINKLHRALFDQLAIHGAASSVGLSFPAYRPRPGGLGRSVRLHGSAQTLGLLMATTWLTGLRDHLQQPNPDILPVPGSVVAHRVVQRVQAQSNPNRLRRRWLKRHPGEAPEVAEAAFPAEAAEKLDLPFIQLRSRSTGQPFPLFVRQVVSAAKPGTFNAYGMGLDGSTVPWF